MGNSIKAWGIKKSIHYYQPRLPWTAEAALISVAGAGAVPPAQRAEEAGGRRRQGGAWEGGHWR